MIALASLAGVLVPGAARAAADLVLAALTNKELAIGTKEAAPLTMTDASGQWHGISIDLWRQIANDLHLQFRFVDAQDVKSLLGRVTGKMFDLGISALTISAPWEATIDFSQLFHLAELGIAAPMLHEGWQPVTERVFSLAFVQVVEALALLLAAAGVLIWLIERRDNERFGGRC